MTSPSHGPWADKRYTRGPVMQVSDMAAPMYSVLTRDGELAGLFTDRESMTMFLAAPETKALLRELVEAVERYGKEINEPFGSGWEHKPMDFAEMFDQTISPILAKIREREVGE